MNTIQPLPLPPQPPEPGFKWTWAGNLPPEVIAEAKAELPKELLVAEALMDDEGIGPETKKLAIEKMNRAVTGEHGAAREHLLQTLMAVLGSGGDLRGDAKKVLESLVNNDKDCLEWGLPPGQFKKEKV